MDGDVAAVSKSKENTRRLSADIEQDASPNGPRTHHNPGDPNVVDWEGPNDPENPMNWSTKEKWRNASMLAIMALITPLASSMFAPGIPAVLKEFRSTSSILASMVVSGTWFLCFLLYILGYAAGPLVIAPLSEMYGRAPIYHTSNVFFIIFTIGCAVSNSLNMLIVFRLLAGVAGSTVITIGAGTFGDIFSAAERGPAVAIWAMGPLIGPIIGPVAGGFLAEAAGWRWVFWVITIAAILTLVMFALMRETYSVKILERKTRLLRKETGNQDLVSKLDPGLTPRDHLQRALLLPLRMLFLSPIVLLFSTYMAMVYGYLYLMFTTLTEVFERVYGFSTGTVGLTYLGLGCGMLLGLFIFGAVSKISAKKLAGAGGITPESRLPLMIPGAFCVPIGLFIYGWTVQYHVFWFVPIFGSALVGIGLISTFLPISTYLVDTFTIYSASALAANTVLRSLVGALLPLAGPPMYAKLGFGWGNSLLGFIALAMCPLPFLFWKYGAWIRTNPRFQVTL
ncbi:major facilitator superfamily domain-containing protein [Hyaloscypha finlandica]|nr:major facilitator superfamily domain-containing protein [Hyaloscypha finlandica]